MATSHDETTTRMIALYMEEAPAPPFLSGFFQSPPGNFHETEEVTLDVIRDDEDVAIVVQDLTAGSRSNEATRYTSKGFIPPIFDEDGTITAYNLIKRQPGMDPFQDPDYLANATEEAFRIFRRLERKIRRAIELMASQVLTTGKLTLVDSSGTALYTLDFSPKTSHFPTAGTPWPNSGYKPLKDLGDLAVVVRRDGKDNPNRLVFGQRALRDFLDNDDVKARVERDRLGLGQMAPEMRGRGATFHGFVWIDHYRFEIWSYDGYYKHPQTGVHTPYVDQDKVIMLSENGRLDLTYGAIPMFRQVMNPALAFLPERMSDGDRGLDLTTNAWFTPDGKHLKVSAGTRPLTIPTAIDTFGCLTTR